MKTKSNPRAFLSFDFDHDKELKVLFAGQAKESSPTTFSIEDWSSKHSLPEKEWERLIKEKISKTNMLIVLVGTHMSTASGVRKEIIMAKELNVPIFGVYIGSANTSSTLPTGLTRNRMVKWDWAKIGTMINTCMNEGKNRS